jgi:hypothetical protein
MLRFEENAGYPEQQMIAISQDYRSRLQTKKLPECEENYCPVL